MTVAELITKLQEFDSSLPVMYLHADNCGGTEEEVDGVRVRTDIYVNKTPVLWLDY